MKCEFIIPGPPMGKGRPRVTKQGHAFTPEKTVVYENLVKVEYQRQCGKRFPDEAQLNVQILAYYAIPKSVSKKKRQAILAMGGPDHLVIKGEYGIEFYNYNDFVNAYRRLLQRPETAQKLRAMVTIPASLPPHGGASRG